jgi:capsular polysaccharide biosynthesis protein
MSEAPLNLKRSLQILRQNWITVVLIVMLGFLAGAGYVTINPPMYVSSAIVVLPSSTRNMTTQALIAGSNPILATAGVSLHPAESVENLSKRVQVTTPISAVLLISAQGETAAQAVETANAVADSYVAYVSAASNPAGPVPARVLHQATSASRTWLVIPLLVTGGIGALAGALAGAVGVLAVKRGDERLRRRDEIADAIGVAILASVPARHPTTTYQWTRLLEEYEPGLADARRLRHALDLLGLAGPRSGPAGPGGSSLTVLSLSSDRGALALGPQLAVLAASQGILTALVISGRPDVSATAALRAACTAKSSSRQPSQLRVAVADDENLGWPDAALTVVVAVVDSWTPYVADAVCVGTPLLAVSAGAATAEQLARVAASAAGAGHHIAGILMADADPADPTTGRLPQPGRRTQMPTRVPGMALVTRR